MIAAGIARHPGLPRHAETALQRGGIRWHTLRPRRSSDKRGTGSATRCQAECKRRARVAQRATVMICKRIVSIPWRWPPIKCTATVRPAHLSAPIGMQRTSAFAGRDRLKRVAYSRSGHRKNLNPVPIFARFGEPIPHWLASLAPANFRPFLGSIFGPIRSVALPPNCI